MLLWLILFIIIVLISFLLAFQSMKDFQIMPVPTQYSLFLIKHPNNLTTESIETLYQDLLKQRLEISLERLFKGSKSALIVYGPRNILSKFPELGLVELEEYSNIDPSLVSGWEVGNKENIFDSIYLLSDEQFFWQLILHPAGQNTFECQIRAILVSSDNQKRTDFANKLGLPIFDTGSQIFSMYQKRARTKSQISNLTVTSSEVLSLSGVKSF